jgi:hypothetical protein
MAAMDPEEYNSHPRTIMLLLPRLLHQRWPSPKVGGENKRNGIESLAIAFQRIGLTVPLRANFWLRRNWKMRKVAMRSFTSYAIEEHAMRTFAST